jgi:hypothetical protein
MQGEELVEQVRTWAGDVADRRSWSDDASDAVTTVSVDEIALDVHLGHDGRWLLIQHGFDVEASEVEPAVAADDGPGAVASFEDSVGRLIESRPALVHGDATRTGETYRVRVFATVATEELSRPAFSNACEEVVRTKRALNRLVTDLGRQRDLLLSLQQLPDASAAVLDDRWRETVDAQATTDTPASGWNPTHVVPQPGMAWWGAPDPSIPPADPLQPGLELEVAERLGDWARVVASNGWSGWVDARLLVPIARGVEG